MRSSIAHTTNNGIQEPQARGRVQLHGASASLNLWGALPLPIGRPGQSVARTGTVDRGFSWACPFVSFFVFSFSFLQVSDPRGVITDYWDGKKFNPSILP